MEPMQIDLFDKPLQIDLFDKENLIPTPSSNNEQLPSTFKFEGFSYTVKDRHDKGIEQVGRYRCSKHRSKKCKATVTITCSDNVQKILTGKLPHTCVQPELNTDAIIDARDEMRELCQAKAIDNVSARPIVLALEVIDEMSAKYEGRPYRFHNTQYLEQLVRRTRTAQFGDWENLIASPPLNMCSPDDPRSFLQFNLTVSIQDELQKIIGWGHPDLIFELGHGKLPSFVDCTFKCVPWGFLQCLIIMVYLEAYGIYVPMFWILLQSKLEEAYLHALHFAITASGRKFMAKTMMSDFELNIMAACKWDFPEALQMGCIFHWKQALRRKLLELRLPKQLISAFLGPAGLINILTVVPLEEIESKAIPYIRANFDEGPHVAKFDIFYNYILKTWMKRYDPKLWNLHHIHTNYSEEDILINRTNNPIERFNRTMNEHFPTPHPTVVNFVQTINEIANGYVTLLHNIKKRKTQPPVHSPVPIPCVPEDYSCFDPKA
jgi:hypothetical protein